MTSTLDFDDILHDAQPALHFGDYAIEEYVTENRDWALTFEFVDGTGAPLDLEALGVTAECVVYAPGDRGQGQAAEVISPTVTIDGTTVTISATDTETAGLADGKSLRKCPWRLTLTHTATGRSCDAFGVRDSTLAIQGDN